MKLIDRVQNATKIQLRLNKRIVTPKSFPKTQHKLLQTQKKMPITLQIPKQILKDPRNQIEADILQRELSDEWLQNFLVPIISQTSRVSIRLMDWLLTNYSKEKKIVYQYNNGKIKRMFDIHNEYQTTLSGYGRPLFDPFRRHDRVFFTINDDTYETTLGQLNFWKWSDKYKVFDYCLKNADKIDNHMAEVHAENDEKKRKRKESGKTDKMKRRNLTKLPKNKCFLFIEEEIVNFND